MALLLLGTAFGVLAGAAVAMYYDVVPAMGSYENVVSSIQAVSYVLAVLLALPYLPLALMAAATKQLSQTLLLAVATLGPLAIALASDGLVSHFLWWAPISDTDRFHVLHHTVTTGAPLSLLYFLFLRLRWQVDELGTVPPPSRAALVATALFVSFMVIAIGVLVGVGLPEVVSVVAVVALIVFPLSRSLAA